MTAFISNLGPMANGLKPKAYFAGTKALLRRKLRRAEVVPAEHDKFPIIKSEDQLFSDPYLREFWLMAPWIGFTALLIISLLK